MCFAFFKVHVHVDLLFASNASVYMYTYNVYTYISPVLFCLGYVPTTQSVPTAENNATGGISIPTTTAILG